MKKRPSVNVHNERIGKPNNLKVLGASKPKGLDRIVKIC
jgi:hypothetical protein